MNRHPPQQPAAKLVAERVLATLERFLRVEAVSGVVLLVATLAALVWANSSHFAGYQGFWHTPVAFRFGGVLISQPLDFWINDGLMTIFFLVVGLEIRREMHEGALATPRAAALPAAAALGGVVVPALIYLAVTDPAVSAGWAVPTATDIAFAVGVLALLGRSIPAGVRVLLLALAVIDDIAAVIIIAAFYSGGFDTFGLLVAGSGVLGVLMLQWLGVRSALSYVAPGAVLWFGLLRAGVHPTLAGVILGLLAPAAPVRQPSRVGSEDVHELASPIRQLRDAERDLLSPAARVQMALHPWVAYGVMPLFALANAGVHFGAIDLADRSAVTLAAGVGLALVIGKPLGILAMSWAAVRAGWCALPNGMTWRAVLLVGLLGGIGFTMAIFIATLAFPDDELLGAAKFGVMTGSAVAAILGLTLGYLTVRRPATPVVAGVFFAIATAITAAAGISLLLPGSVLDAMWRIKPEEHEQLLSAAIPVAIGFFGLSAIMAITSIGALLRRRWAWRLAIVIFMINGIGDAVRAALGAAVEGVAGVSAVALILFWLTRPGVRATFDR